MVEILKDIGLKNRLFRAYLAPLATTTIYVALVLTAMQVRLATDRLRANLDF